MRHHRMLPTTLFCLGLIPLWANADTPWKTTRWQVACTHELQQRADQSWSEWEKLLETIVEREVPPGDVDEKQWLEGMLRDHFRRFANQSQSLCRPDSELMAVTTEQLERASEWLRDLGFSGPELALVDQDIESHLFPSNLLDCLTHYCAGLEYLRKHFGEYRLGGMLRLDLFSMNALFPVREAGIRGRSINASSVLAAYTPVHELFHAVQMGSSGFTQDTMFRCSNDWLVEGTARYSDVVAAQKWGSLVTPAPVERYYDDSLHIPPHRCAEELTKAEERRLHGWRYGSWGFWAYLGQRTGTRDNFEYLATVLAQDLSVANGLFGTHEALKNWHPEGLYAFYPEFVRDHLNHERYFSDEGMHQVSLTWLDDPKLVSGDIKAVASKVYDLDIAVPEGRSAVLRVRIVQDHEDLHLVAEDQLLSRAVGSDHRNVYESFLVGQAQTQHQLVRVANIAPDAVSSREREFQLELELIPIEPCEVESMEAAVNHNGFPGSAIFPAHVSDEDAQVWPGDGSLTIRGLVNDDGHACVHPVSALDMTGSILTGHADDGVIEETMRARAQAVQERLEGMDLDRLRSMDTREGVSPDQMAELMELAGEFGDMTDVLAPPEDEPADVVFHIYSPHQWIHRQGVLPPPRATQHAGLGGWQSNAAATLVVQLPGTAVADLEAGKTYRGRAYSPASDENERPQIVPTLAGFYSEWQGRFHPVPYPPPQNAAQARRQERLKANCRQRHGMAERMREQMEDGAARIFDEMLSQGDCRYKGMAFEGATQVVTGSLSGEVHVEEVTVAGVKARFTLAGTGTRETTDYALEHDERTGVLSGETREVSRQQGPVLMEGQFFAPVGVDGVPRAAGGYRTVTLPGKVEQHDR